MAVYPAGNPGAHPLDPSSDVGKFRMLISDVTSEPYDPPVPGIQNYAVLSDAEIEAYLEAGDGSVLRAIGFYYMALAGEASSQSMTIKDYDLSVSFATRAGDLRNMALLWFQKADDEDSAAAEDAMMIVPVGRRDSRRRPELAPHTYC